LFFYAAVGVLDIFSTQAALTLGVGEEANPVMRAAMDQFGPGWAAAKIALQIIISAMVLWYPHRIVMALFFIAISGNALVVGNNFRILFGA